MLDRRSFIALAPATLAATLPALTGRAVAQSTFARPDPGVTEVVVAATSTFLDGLSSAQRQRVLYRASDPALRQWFYFPSRRDRSGIALGELTEPQRAAAFAVAAAILSESGFRQFRGILAAEDELGRRNGESHVNSGRYFIAIFGTPGVTSRFTVQINGHHLAINTTYDNGRVSPAPSFTGVDPVEIDMDGRRVRPMLAKTDAYTGVLNSLNETERAAARIEYNDDVSVGTGASTRYPASVGTIIADLGRWQQDRVTDFVHAWVGDAPAQVADILMQQYQADYGRTRLAWSGSPNPDTRGAYMRIDGPRLWIEFCNVGRFGNGDNHYHTVFRDQTDDYLA